MRIYKDTIRVTRGESWTFDTEIINNDGSPYVISNQIANPYFCTTVATGKYSENGRYVHHFWSKFEDEPFTEGGACTDDTKYYLRGDWMWKDSGISIDGSLTQTFEAGAVTCDIDGVTYDITSILLNSSNEIGYKTSLGDIIVYNQTDEWSTYDGETEYLSFNGSVEVSESFYNTFIANAEYTGDVTPVVHRYYCTQAIELSDWSEAPESAISAAAKKDMEAHGQTNLTYAIYYVETDGVKEYKYYAGTGVGYLPYSCTYRIAFPSTVTSLWIDQEYDFSMKLASGTLSEYAANLTDNYAPLAVYDDMAKFNVPSKLIVSSNISFMEGNT